MLAVEEHERKRSQVIDALTQINPDDLLQEGSHSFVNDENLTDDQKALLKEIQGKFDPLNNVSDVCILYEVTGYKDESTEEDFWDQYLDYFELGNDQNLVKKNKLDLRSLNPEQRNALRESRAL